ncbi:unnamed protein product [Cuscuta campestris]|uniref:Ubiquitin-like protease family profile domain-containing protein n=1 Tax=Cuscuta campestris TaxID=132261 RepID=A0A484LVU7_9ASTE|nr:unnamed protein product [Cuscuta campestris]
MVLELRDVLQKGDEGFGQFPDTLSNSLLKLIVNDVEPTDSELLLGSVKELFKGKGTSAVKARKKLSLSISKRFRKVKERQMNIRDAFVRQKTAGEACGSVLKRKGKTVCVENKDSEQLDMVKEIKKIKEKQDAQDKKLDEILGILLQKTANVEAGSASGKGSLMGGNEEPRVRNEGITIEGNTDVEGKCGVDLDLSCDDGGPSFDLLTPLPRVDAVGAEIRNDKSGNVSVTEACDPVKEGTCLDIPYTETQYDPHFLELIDVQEEMFKKSLQNASSGPMVSCEGIVGQDAIQGWCKRSVSGDDTAKTTGNTTMPKEVHVPVDVESAFGGSSGSNKGNLGQHIDGGKRKRSLDDDDFERFFTSSGVGSGDHGVNGAQDALVVFSKGSDSITACVEIDRPKRVHKNPERYTPTEVEHHKEKRKLERMERAKQHMERVRLEVCHGPFSKDPMAMLADVEIQKHVEIVMHFLEVKGRQYNLLQMYTTITPYFLQGLYNHQQKVIVGKAKKAEVVNNRNLSSEVLGLAREYSRPWSECDFVYMPLNTSDHWILLVLEVEGRTIRVYDSKGRKGKSSRALNEYVECMTELLPVLLNLLSVYDEHSDGPMGKKKFNIKVVDECPQQDDGHRIHSEMMAQVFLGLVNAVNLKSGWGGTMMRAPTPNNLSNHPTPEIESSSQQPPPPPQSLPSQQLSSSSLAFRAHPLHPARPAIVDLFNLYLGVNVRQKLDEPVREPPNKAQKRVTALNREFPPQNEQFLIDFEHLQSQFTEQEQLHAVTEAVLISLVIQCSSHAPRAEFLLFAINGLCSIGYINWDTFLPSLLSSVSSAGVYVGKGNQLGNAGSSAAFSQSGMLSNSNSVTNISNFQASTPASPLPKIHGIGSPVHSAPEPSSCVTLSPLKSSDVSGAGQQSTAIATLSVRDNELNSLHLWCCKIILTGLETNLKPATHADILHNLLNWLIRWDQKHDIVDFDSSKHCKLDKAYIECLHSCLDVIWLLVEDEKCRVPFYELLRSGLQFIENIPDDEALFTLILEIHRRRDWMAMHMQMLDQHLHCPTFGTPRLLPQCTSNMSGEQATNMRYSPITYPSVLGEPLHGEVILFSYDFWALILYILKCFQTPYPLRIVCSFPFKTSSLSFE